MHSPPQQRGLLAFSETELAPCSLWCYNRVTVAQEKSLAVWQNPRLMAKVQDGHLGKESSIAREPVCCK